MRQTQVKLSIFGWRVSGPVYLMSSEGHKAQEWPRGTRGMLLGINQHHDQGPGRSGSGRRRRAEDDERCGWIVVDGPRIQTPTTHRLRSEHPEVQAFSRMLKNMGGAVKPIRPLRSKLPLDIKPTSWVAVVEALMLIQHLNMI